MRIDFVEIRNFRRLTKIRIDFSEKTTLFVGANNSGKTSAIAALRYFLISQNAFSINDISIIHWPGINELGLAFETAEDTVSLDKWREFLPSIDVWLSISEDEVHRVAHLIPTLEWSPDQGIGVRLQLEPKDSDELLKAYLKLRKLACEAVGTEQPGKIMGEPAVNAVEAGQAATQNSCKKLTLWPESLMDFFKKRLTTFLTVNAYLLDPSKKTPPKNGIAQPQQLPADTEPLDGNPFKGMIRIDEVPAHRGMSDYSETIGVGEESEGDERGRRQLLTAQLRAYYNKHLDPLKAPDSTDIRALQAIQEAQTAFDERLKDCFKIPLGELEDLGYPGVSNPRLLISTSLKPIEGLEHGAAVQYDVAPTAEGTAAPYRLPEQCNGLGYQNLISMVFRLISFRDEWMKVGKAAIIEEGSGERQTPPPPLHLVLLEEPEAHLHVQVQQVFIRKAYEVLRRHPDLQDKKNLWTQLVVSTHSSHVAHEVKFANMRYFRRQPARGAGEMPTSSIINLSEVFGTPDDTARFVTRYLQSTHADLFFADGAIIVEGAAERMLVPHFIRNEHGKLYSCYVTLLEIGGSHAHRLKRLIEHLGLNTLIVTDIDAVDKLTKQRVQPKTGSEQITGNNVLKLWHPAKESLDELLNTKEEEKEKHYDNFSVRVAYQTPVQVRLVEDRAFELALPRTFEDALVFQNIDFFRNAEGSVLVKKFKDAILSNKDVSALHKELLSALETGSKAGLALDMLYSKDEPLSIEAPEYIKKGLEWLEDQLIERQQEVLVTQNGKVNASQEGASDGKAS